MHSQASGTMPSIRFRKLDSNRSPLTRLAPAWSLQRLSLMHSAKRMEEMYLNHILEAKPEPISLHSGENHSPASSYSARASLRPPNHGRRRSSSAKARTQVFGAVATLLLKRRAAHYSPTSRSSAWLDASGQRALSSQEDCTPDPRVVLLLKT
jgi:hypothetical protein